MGNRLFGGIAMRLNLASIVLVLPLLLEPSVPKAQAADPRLEAMDAIANAAIKVCDVAKAAGNSQRDDVKAEVKVQLSGFAKFLASVGLAAEGSHDVEQWVGPTQDQIPHVVEVISDCRLKATIEFKEFYAYFLTTASVVPPSAPTPSPIPTPTTPPPPSPVVKLAKIICHGELPDKCRAHPFNEFEQCSDSNGVGGANPALTGKRLCGNDQFKLRSAGASVPGDHCGYAWFEVGCQ